MAGSLAGFLTAQALIGAPYSIHAPTVGNVQPLLPPADQHLRQGRGGEGGGG